MRALKNFNVVDLFCGMGGASQGLLHFLQQSGITPEYLASLGYRLRLININHWEVSLETIERNIAFAELYNAKIQDVNPTFTLRGEPLHFLIAAPECIMHSQARGNRPIKDQSRTTAAWILDWLDLKPLGFFFENVPEWKKWGPLDAQMKPLKARQGENYQGFLRAIRKRGYALRDQAVVCADYGDPTIRKRLFILGSRTVASDATTQLSWPAPTHTKHPSRYPDRKPWATAREIIDWSLRGRFITHREEGPHAVPTLRRQRSGFDKQDRLLAPAYVEVIDRLIPIADRYALDTAAIVTEHRIGRPTTKEERKLNDLIRTSARARARAAVTRAYRTPIAEYRGTDFPAGAIEEIQAFTLGQNGGATAHLDTDPLATIATTGAISLTEGFLVKANASETSTFGDAVQSLDRPMSTVVTKDCRALAAPTIAQLRLQDDQSTKINDETATAIPPTLASPFIANVYGLRANGDEGRTQDLDTPLNTACAGGKHHGLAEPIIVSRHSERRGDRRAHDLDSPVPAATGSGAGYLAEPILAVVQHGSDDNRQPSLDAPLQTITSKGSTGIADPVIVPQDSRSGTRTVDEPVPTATTISRIGLAEAVITSNHFGNGGTTIGLPLGAATTGHGGGFGLAEAFITPNFGERDGQQPRVHDLDNPLPAITSHGAGMFSQPALSMPEDGPFILIDGVPYGINILYRMLTARELARAHSLENVSLPASEKDAVKLVGNSIPKKTAAALIGHVLGPILRALEDMAEAA